MAKGKTVKRAVTAIICLAAAAALCFGAVKAFGQNGEEQNEPAYREYKAAKGNITVGTSESGTASVEREYVTFSASAEVEEVFVKMGSSVKKGDPIAKLNTDDIDEIKAQYESQILSAKLSLDAAVNERELKLSQAENTYKSASNSGSSAEQEYEMSVEKLGTDIEDAEKNLSELKKQLAEYEELASSYPADNKKHTLYDETYEAYTETYEGYEKTLKEYEKQLTEAREDYDEYVAEVSEEWESILTKQNNVERTREAMKEAEKTLEDAKKAASAEGVDPTSTTETTAQKTLKSAQEAYDKAVESYNNALNEYNSVQQSRYDTIKMRMDKRESAVTELEEKIEEHKEIMSDCSEKMSDYKSEMDSYNEDYNELYGNLDEEGIAEKTEKLKSDIKSAEYELEKLKLNQSGQLLAAEQSKDTALLEASMAQSEYDLAVQEINKSVSDKQDEYDRLNEEYETLLENIGDGLYVYADCDGLVSSVNIAEGDTINTNMTLASIMDSSEVYVSVAVAEEDISSLSVGQEAAVTFSAYENAEISGEIDTIAVEPSRSSGSVSYEVTVKVTPSENITVYEGMTCDVTFLQKQVSDVIYVNIQAVKYIGNGKSAVLVYDSRGNVTEKEVVTGFTDGRYVEIISGLEQGDVVLAESAVSRK